MIFTLAHAIDAHQISYRILNAHCNEPSEKWQRDPDYNMTKNPVSLRLLFPRVDIRLIR